MAKTLQALTACNETKAAYLCVSLPPSMDNIVDNVQTKETIVYEDVRAKLPDLSAKGQLLETARLPTAYRSQAMRRKVPAQAGRRRTATGAGRGRCAPRGTLGISVGS